MTISGEIADIRFRNDENGYTILTIDYEGDPLVCVGTFPPISEGQLLTLEGRFVVHPKFGKQFKAEKVVSSEISGEDGIVRYLGSGIIKGIRERTALSIVNKFGKDTLNVIEYTPHLLSSIRGISKAKAIEIGESYKNIKDMQDSIVFLQNCSMTIGMALKIYKKYGENTIAKVKTNPYILIEDVDGIGFNTADRIALAMGIDRSSAFRISAGIIHTLKDAAERGGNTFLPRDELISSAARILGSSEKDVDEGVNNLVLDCKVKSLVIDDVQVVMLRRLFVIEYSAAVKLIDLMNEANMLKFDVSSDVAQFEKLNNVAFHDQQKTAIDAAINNGVVVITGGPGTGKTTIIKCVISLLKQMNKRLLLVAPTGRAAKRLTESTGEDASTIHRALMLGKNMNESKEPVKADVVIVDEFSMVDITLFNVLLSRVCNGTRLVLVGDADQLPSVGAGNVLSDIMNSRLVPTVRLTKIFRQAEESLIVTNAHDINQGVMPNLAKKSGDFFFCKANSAEEIASITVGLAEKRIPNYLGIEPFKAQVLCPLKNGVAGTINLNNLLGEKLNPNKDAIKGEEASFRLGDKVMHITNNYTLEWQKTSQYGVETGVGVFNGDIGVITRLDKQSNEIVVTFEDNREAIYTLDIRNQLIPAYAITVHKSQGSEFDAVIMPIVGGNPAILTRNLLYTAITRAKKLVVLVGDEYNIKRMVDNDYIAKRYSALKYFLVETCKKQALLFGEPEKTDELDG